MVSTIERPSPAPPLVRAGSARLKRSKAWARNAGGNPGPSSATVELDGSVALVGRRASTVPAPWRSALSTRLASACSSRTRSATTHLAAGGLDREPATVGAGVQVVAAGDAGQQLVDGHGREADLQPLPIGARQQQQVVGQPRQAHPRPRRPSAARPRARRGSERPAARPRAPPSAASPGVAARGSRRPRSAAPAAPRRPAGRAWR